MNLPIHHRALAAVRLARPGIWGPLVVVFIQSASLTVVYTISGAYVPRAPLGILTRWRWMKIGGGALEAEAVVESSNWRICSICTFGGWPFWRTRSFFLNWSISTSDMELERDGFGEDSKESYLAEARNHLVLQLEAWGICVMFPSNIYGCCNSSCIASCKHHEGTWVPHSQYLLTLQLNLLIVHLKASELMLRRFSDYPFISQRIRS